MAQGQLHREGWVGVGTTLSWGLDHRGAGSALSQMLGGCEKARSGWRAKERGAKLVKDG